MQTSQKQSVYCNLLKFKTNIEKSKLEQKKKLESFLRAILMGHQGFSVFSHNSGASAAPFLSMF